MGYVLVQFGSMEEAQVYRTLDEALGEAHCHVSQYISDFLRHDLPIKIGPEMARRFDVRLYKFDDDTEVELPFQGWLDQYYKDMKRWKRENEEREYERFLELYEKFKDRIPGSSND